MAVNLFETITDDPALNTKYLKLIVSQQSRQVHVRLGTDIIHIISIYSITYNWHGKFKWLKKNNFNQPYSLFPIQTDSIISIKSMDFQEIYIVHCSSPNSNCYNYHPYKDKFYEFISKKPTYSRYSHAALISDGRVVSTGGTTKHIDIYDPRSGAWINHNYTENILDFGEKCCIVQDELNANIVHVVGGKNIVCNALHSLDIRNGFKIIDRNEICIERANNNIPLQRLTAHAAVMSDQNKMLLFGGRSLSGAKNPSEFIKQVMGRPVIVKLNSGVTYHGILAGLDEYMNIAMEQTEEYEDGKFQQRYGDVFIRGNNS